MYIDKTWLDMVMTISTSSPLYTPQVLRSLLHVIHILRESNTIYVLRKSNTICWCRLPLQNLDTPPYHMTASSSENRHWRQEAIKGLAEYCDAQALLIVTWNIIVFLQRETVCARKTTPTIFRGKHFSLRLRRSHTTSSRACARFWNLHECFDFPDGSRHKI